MEEGRSSHTRLVRGVRLLQSPSECTEDTEDGLSPPDRPGPGDLAFLPFEPPLLFEDFPPPAETHLERVGTPRTFLVYNPQLNDAPGNRCAIESTLSNLENHQLLKVQTTACSDCFKKKKMKKGLRRQQTRKVQERTRRDDLGRRSLLRGRRLQPRPSRWPALVDRVPQTGHHSCPLRPF